MLTEREQRNGGGIPRSDYEKHLVKSLRRSLVAGMEAAKTIKQLYSCRPATNSFQSQCAYNAGNTAEEIERLIARLDNAAPKS